MSSGSLTLGGINTCGQSQMPHTLLESRMEGREGPREKLEVAEEQTAIMKVGFLKTHKCASSAVQNILLHWGLKRGLFAKKVVTISLGISEGQA